MRTPQSIINEIVSIGKQYPDYKFCSYDCNTMSYSGGLLTTKHRFTVFFGLPNTVSTKNVSSEHENLEVAINDLIHKIELSFNKSKSDLISLPLTKSDFLAINFGVWQYKNQNNYFIYQAPMGGDKIRRAQEQPHIFVDTKLCKYDRPVDDFEQAIKIFNDEYR
jgi:hypothetical protein